MKQSEGELVVYGTMQSYKSVSTFRRKMLPSSSQLKYSEKQQTDPRTGRQESCTPHPTRFNPEDGGNMFLPSLVSASESCSHCHVQINVCVDVAVLRSGGHDDL
jgi:hypothetical protein